MHTLNGVAKTSARALMLVLAVVSLVATALVATPPAPASAAPADGILAADLTQFQPGNIISNEVFFDSSTMTEAQIDAFLRSKVANCLSGYVCLKDYRQTTPDRAADEYCDAYTGVSDERSAAIIAKIATACGINPQVLLVMLQKEQALVTHTWPSDWRYTKAMGQGCPDTADCDSKYAGFFNQVYGAARQFQIYSANRYFKYYEPGKTWNVRYHPDISCGTGRVYIENQATANLYYYTPYQPNAASLRAGYGEGDSCSSYGNRNFFNYFTDWFGSTQVPRSTLVKLATDSTVWLINGGRRWHIGNVEDYIELSRVFGGAVTVPSTYISSAQYSGDAGAVLRDSGTGEISLIQDGQRHRLVSCEAVADFGGTCSAPVDVSSALLSRVPSGAAVGSYFRVRGSDRWGRFEDGRDVTPLYNASAARAMAGDVRVTPYAPLLNSDLYAAASKRPMRFAPAQLVRSSDNPRVFLSVDFDKLAYVPSWESVADYNRSASDLAVVSASDLSGYSQTGTVAPLLSCDGITYLPAGGWITRISDASRIGITPLSGTAATCAQFSTREGLISGDVAIKTADSAEVSILEGGTRRPALSWSALVGHNGGTAPIITTLSSSIRQAVPVGAPLVTGMVVKSTSSPDLLWGGDARVSWIPTAGLARDLGITLTYTVLPDAQAATLPRGAALSSWIQCGETLFFAAEGRLWPVSSTAARGFTPSALESGACGSLTRSSTSALGLVAVKREGAADVFVARDGALRYVSSWDALVKLNGGTAPRVLTVSRDALSALPTGEAITG